MEKTKESELPSEYPCVNFLMKLLVGVIVLAVYLTPICVFLILFALVVKVLIYQEKDVIYHFSSSQQNFDSIISTKCLMSLTGGRCYATSWFNPELGISSDDTKRKQVIIIEGSALSCFKPIVSNFRDFFHIWKWWKSFRGEWVSRRLRDIGFDSASSCQEKNIISKDVVTKNERSISLIFSRISKAYYLDNKKKVISCQKMCFWFGEWIISIFLWLAIALTNAIFYYRYFGWDSFSGAIDVLTPIVMNNLCMILSVIFLLVSIVIIIYIKLKEAAIKARLEVQSH